MKYKFLLALVLSYSVLFTGVYAGPECASFKNKELQTGHAVIKGTDPLSDIEGEVTFYETNEGLRIHAKLMGTPEGKHGFHIHEFGDLGNAGKNAGGHYNPEETSHGYVPREGIARAHAGDLGNIVIAEDGRGELDVTVKGLKLTGGKYNVAGRAIIVHEKEDDYGQPTGNAGNRIAAGSILLVDGENLGE